MARFLLRHETKPFGSGNSNRSGPRNATERNAFSISPRPPPLFPPFFPLWTLQPFPRCHKGPKDTERQGLSQQISRRSVDGEGGRRRRQGPPGSRETPIRAIHSPLHNFSSPSLHDEWPIIHAEENTAEFRCHYKSAALFILSLRAAHRQADRPTAG